jgi:hypothetical protein
MNFGKEKRGSALLVAVAIFAVLIALGLTFWLTTRYEWRTASGVVALQRADLAANAGTAIAISFLQRDLQAHASYTSLDHAWRTYFNGTWVQSKGWALPEGPIENGGVPRVYLSAQPIIQDTRINPKTGLERIPPQRQYDGRETGEWLYIPRVVPSGANTRASLPLDQTYLNSPVSNFVVDNSGTAGTPAQIIDFFNDVDNDNEGLGLRDSMWIPLPKERNFGRTDFDMDGIPDLLGDGLDNDLDGETDEFGEIAYFIYFGGNDGLDNNGVGGIDEPAEDRVYVTAPIGTLGNYAILSGITQRDPQTLAVINTLGPMSTDPLDGDVDVLDNDWNLVEGDHDEYLLIVPPNIDYSDFADPRVPQELGKAYNLIAATYLNAPVAPFLPTSGRGIGAPFQASALTAAGEPVCDVVGRFAVLITDENSKVNMNAAGGHTRVAEVEPTDVIRSMNQGVGPIEYETRPLPDLGQALSRNLWYILMGYPEATVFGNEPDFIPFLDDATSPGYGLIDDNGNALSLALNGIDDDGDALYYKVQYEDVPGIPSTGDNVDNDLDGLVDEPGEGYQMGVDEGLRGFDTNGDGTLDLISEIEGVDEPGEYRSFQPYRDMFAEAQGLDIDLDGVPGEFGELGDTVFRTREQFQLADQIAGITTDRLKPFVSLNASDKGDARTERASDVGDLFGVPMVASYDLPSGLRALSGMKLDYNYADAGQIADRLKVNWAYSPTAVVNNTATATLADFALGLRREDTTVVANDPGVLPQITMPADDELKAMQLASSVKDARDTDFQRTPLVTGIRDSWWDKIGGNSLPPREIQYNVAGVECIRINELMVRPVRRVEAEVDFTIAERNPNLLPFSPAGLPPLDRRFNNFDSTTPMVTTPFPTGSDWQLQTSATNPPNSLGSSTAYRTTLNFVNDPSAYADVVQYMFAPSVNLPPGRYYLVVNTTDSNGNVTINPGEEDFIQVRIKYVKPNGSLPVNNFFDSAAGPVYFGDTTILEDRGTLTPNEFNTTLGWVPAVLAGQTGAAIPEPAGDVFLADTNLAPPSTLDPPNQVGYVGYSPLGTPTDSNNTVEIPPLSADPAQQVYLCVSIRRNRPALDTTPLALNFFDFSQEPDHEWVEIVNIAERDPGKSPFEQAINIAGWQLEINRPSGIGTSDRKLFTVPGSTTVKAQGTLLSPGGSLILAFNKFDDALPTIPALPRYTHSVYANGIGMAKGEIPTTAGTRPYYKAVTAPILDTNFNFSVFSRPDSGVLGFYEDFIDRDGDTNSDLLFRPDDVLQSTQDAIGSEGPSKAWDRVVELISSEIDGVTTAQELARLVLAGGTLPNYPEHDGIDNDGDNLVLENDFVDNDGDGLVDELTDLDDNRPEGVDEGRWPATTLIDVPREWSKPGSYGNGALATPQGNDAIPYVTVDPAAIGSHGVAGLLFDSSLMPYIGAPGSPPEQKNINERRWYPGDNVVVTLYDGDISQNKIADQVTYTENDVVNRYIDDNTAIGGQREPLDPNRQTFWPQNTMGVDFYFSLQRKHPLYNGDLHGVTNRWQATDGAYDDWQAAQRISEVPTATPLARNSEYARWNPAPAGITDTSFTFANAAVWASVRGDGFDNNFGGYTTVVTAGQGFGWVRNREFVSPGDALTVPHFAMTQNYIGGYPAVSTAQEFVLGQSTPRDVAALVDSASMSPLTLTVGQAQYFSMLPGPGAQTLTPLSQPDIFGPLPEAWVPVFLSYLPAPTVRDPAALYDDDATIYSKNYVLAQPDPSAAILPALASRSPMQVPNTASINAPMTTPRAIMYISGNAVNFDPIFSHIVGPLTPVAESLFTWDAGDGLQNGEYDAYVVTAEPLRGLEEAATLSGPATTTPGNNIGVALVRATRGENPSSLYVDCEFFTDRGARDPNWGISADFNIADPSTLDLSNNGIIDGDSFGLVAGLSPSSDGVVHYGIIRIENNRLALRLRNWSERGRLNRFSRVVLTPRHRTPGRLNINTAQVSNIQPGGPALNPLMGLPGLLFNLNVDGTVGTPFVNFTDNLGPADPEYVNAMLRSQWVVVNRPDYIDGRYYVRPSDMVGLDDDLYTATVPNAVPLVAGGTTDPIARYNEIVSRYSRLANMITTRSDTFEIIVTAEVGFVSNEDVNRDGKINYRGDFVTEGQKKTRVVYER